MYHNRSDGFRSVHADHDDFGLASVHSSLKSLFLHFYYFCSVFSVFGTLFLYNAISEPHVIPE